MTHPSSAPHIKPTVSTKASDNTDWYALLKKDLSVSDSEGGSPLFSTADTNTDIQKNPDIATETNTSPLCILNMGTTEETLITTHGAPDNMKSYFKIPKKTTTQLGSVPLVRLRESETQTDKPSAECDDCKNEEHAILQRQAYIRADAYRNIGGGYKEPHNFQGR